MSTTYALLPPLPLAAILHQAPVALLVAEAPSGRFLLLNERAQALFGSLPPAATRTAAALLDLHPCRPDGTPYTHDTLPLVRALRQGADVVDEEMLFPHPGGGRRRLLAGAAPLHDDQGRIVAAVATFVDVTAQRAAEAALHEAEWRQHQALEAAGLGTWDFDLATGLTHFDARAQALFGFSEAVLGPEAVEQAIHPDDLDAFRRARAAALDPAHPAAFDETHRVVRPDGTVRWVRGHARVLFEGQEARRAVGVVADVTEQVEAQKALRWAKETLQERVAARTAQVRALSARLAAAEQQERQRVAEVLHDDLQQQLYALSLTLGLLRKAAPGAAEALQDQAEHQLAQAAHLVRTLSTALSPPVLRHDHLDLLLQWLALHVEGQYGLHVEVVVHDDLVLTEVSRRLLLYQVLRELLFNVVKHAGTKQATLEARRDGAWGVVVVSDRGVGFDLEAVRQRRQAAGGLGLVHLQERFELLGGRFEVTSRPGQGTRVTLRLPLHAPEDGDAPKDGDAPEDGAA